MTKYISHIHYSTHYKPFQTIFEGLHMQLPYVLDKSPSKFLLHLQNIFYFIKKSLPPQHFLSFKSAQLGFKCRKLIGLEKETLLKR